MKAIGAKRIERCKIETLEDIEQHQRREALRVRRQLENIEPAIPARNRRHHLAAMAGKVIEVEKRAARSEGGEHVLRHRSPVKGLGPLRGDCAQCAPQRRKFDQIALRGRAPGKQEVPRGSGVGT